MSATSVSAGRSSGFSNRLVRQPWAVLACWAVTVCWGGLAFGQERPAQPQVEHTPIRSSVGGMHSYVPDRWSLITLNVTNPDDVPRDIISATYFDSEPTLQYARRMWLPPRSKLHTWLPVRVPKPQDNTVRGLPFHSLVVDASKERDILLKDDTGQLLQSGNLSAQTDPFVTGFIDEPSEVAPVDANAAYSLIVACRRDQNFSRRATNLAETLFAPDDMSLQPFDQLVICCNRPLADAAGLAAIRRWMYNGGRLWVMLNQSDPDILETILGDSFACEVVDRVRLTTVQIDPAHPSIGSGTPPVEYEDPIDLVRVVVDEREADVLYKVNGWPAAFFRKYGRGALLVTTLAPRAWIRPTTPEETQAQREVWERSNRGGPADSQDSPFTVKPPMHVLAGKISQVETKTTDLEQALTGFATEHIGYSIPARGLIGSLLAGFGGLVALCGAWLWRRKALEHLGWAGPGLAVATAVVVVGVGAGNRHQIETSVAAVQLVEALPGVDDANVTGSLAFYSPESVPWKIRTTEGGRLLPEMNGLEGTTRRLIWNDLGEWSWENLQLATPQRTARYQQTLTPPTRIEARGTFGPDGMTGKLAGGDIGKLSELVVATRTGRVGVDLHADGTFAAPADRVFSKDQYIETSLLGDEQDRRRRAYPAILQQMFGEEWSGAPLLMGWSSEPQVGFEFDEGRRRLGASLLIVPVAIERPATGATLKIPGPFLPFRITNLPDGKTPSSPVWLARKQEWIERKEVSNFWLRFQLPAALLPLEITGARLVVQVTGPVTRLELFGRKSDPAATAASAFEAVPIERWDNPVQSHRFDLTNPELLQVVEGNLYFGMTAGDPDRRKGDKPSAIPVDPNSKKNEDFSDEEFKTSPWQIVSVELEVDARIPTDPEPAAGRP